MPTDPNAAPAAPTPDPVAGNEAEPSNSTVDWSNLVTDFDNPDLDAPSVSEPNSSVPGNESEPGEVTPPAPVPQTPSPAAPTEPAAPTAPAEPPPATPPAPQTPAAAEPQQPPATPPAPAQPEPQAQPQAPTQTPEQIEQLRRNFISEAASKYTLSKEQADSLIADPNTVLPNLAATLEANILSQATQMVSQVLQQVLPSFVGNVIEQRERTATGENEFFSQWEELKPHKERVVQLARMYRQANPQVPKEQFIRDVGMQAWFALGLDAAKLAAKLQPPAAPQVPAASPTAPAPRTDYGPAQPGGAVGAPPSAGGNPFAEMAEQWID